MREELEQYKQIQQKAKIVLDRIASTINEESTEGSISQKCVDLFEEFGVTQTWYYSVPAFVLVGSRSCLSISGRDYAPSDEKVGAANLVTIDLSPLEEDIWGDCARSFPVQDGRVTSNPSDYELSKGLAAERELHRKFMDFVRPEMTFETVFHEMNREISDLGFVNLDFMANVGHSISKRKEDRNFFMEGNTTPLDQVDLFTFEPHIRLKNGLWGFKHENIYYFDEAGRICEL